MPVGMNIAYSIFVPSIASHKINFVILIIGMIFAWAKRLSLMGMIFAFSKSMPSIASHKINFVGAVYWHDICMGKTAVINGHDLCFFKIHAKPVTVIVLFAYSAVRFLRC